MAEKNTMQDMTVGNPASHILKFFFPLLFGMLFQQFYNLVDTAIVGRFLGPDDRICEFFGDRFLYGSL